VHSFPQEEKGAPDMTTTTTTTNLVATLGSRDAWMMIVPTVCLGTVVLAAALYGKSWRRRWRQLRESTFFGSVPAKDPFRLVRVTNAQGSPNKASRFAAMDLQPSFVAAHAKQHRMVSLGTYLQSLRPSLAPEGIPDWLQGELQAAFGVALVRAVGPTVGWALLPGMGLLDSVTGRIATLVTSRWMSGRDAASDAAALVDPKEPADAAGIPLSLFSISYLTEVNYRKNRGKRTAVASSSSSNNTISPPMTPWQNYCRGEVGYNSSFAGVVMDLPEEDKAGGEKTSTDSHQDPTQKDLLPIPFRLVEDWPTVVAAMEELLTSASVDDSTKPTYDPDSRRLAEPTLIDDRLLPDLYLGYGDALCTHTQREILHNRLLSILLNRLAANYVRSGADDANFIVLLDNGKVVCRPTDLIQALIDMGHEIEVAVTSHITTFGLGLCVKEEKEDKDDDQSSSSDWTLIPMACFLENGLSDAKDRQAYTAMTHGGLNMEIRSGPLLSNVSIQHYIAIEGICAWASNHNAQVPWIQDVDCGPRLMGKDVLPAVRLAALQALVVVTVGSELHLPSGGYGLTGVCNDTAAWLEHALFRSTNMYPITLNGRFAMHMLRRARRLKGELQVQSDCAPEVRAVDTLIQALTALPSDMTTLPSGMLDQCNRQLHCMHPGLPFIAMQKSRQIVEEVRDEIRQAG
jgi:hypothetical protein